MHIAVVYSLPTRRAFATKYKVADEDTEVSAREVAEALKIKGVQVSLVSVSEDGLNEIDKISADLIFNLIEWDGLDISLSLTAFGLLEKTKIPFTGCSQAALAAVADKIKMKQTLELNGLPTPAWQYFATGNELINSKLKFPVIVKLALEHCSIGLTRDAIAKDTQALSRLVKERLGDFKQPVYAEEFIAGREFQVTLLDRPQGLTVLPPAEIIFKNPQILAFLTYHSRWDEAHADYQTSTVELANLSSGLNEKLGKISLEAYAVFGCRDYARIDIRTRGDEVYILEVNPNPGLGEDEEYGMTVSYREAGLTFSDFIWEIIESCLRRNAK